MIRALIAAELRPFLSGLDIPADIHVDWFPGAGPVPDSDAEGLLPLVSTPVGEAEISRLPRLRVIANYGVGHDNIDLAAAARHGVRVSNTPGVLTAATAELTWALILAAARRVGEGERLVRRGDWGGWTPTQLLGISLQGKMLGIIGAGRIGREVARRAPAFGMETLYWSRTRRPEWETAAGAEWRDLDALLQAADVLSIHVALTPDTRHLIGAPQLERMKSGSILVNTARGAIVDETALADALETGRLRAAGLDVYTDEPDVPERLRALPNVVLLPHLGSATEEARQGMWRLAWTNLLAGLRGDPLPNPVTVP